MQAASELPDVGRAQRRCRYRMTVSALGPSGLRESSVVSTIAEFGNSSAVTIPFSMAASAEVSHFKPGERVLLTAVGAGLTSRAAVYGF